MIKIRTTTTTLSDGSKVYDVHIGNVTLPAITFMDACELMDEIQASIVKHTNEDATAIVES